MMRVLLCYAHQRLTFIQEETTLSMKMRNRYPEKLDLTFNRNRRLSHGYRAPNRSHARCHTSHCHTTASHLRWRPSAHCRPSLYDLLGCRLAAAGPKWSAAAVEPILRLYPDELTARSPG